MPIFFVLGFLLAWSASGPRGACEYALLRTEGGPGAVWETVFTGIDTTYEEHDVELEKRYFYAVRTLRLDSLIWIEPKDTTSAALVDVSQGLAPRRIYFNRGPEDWKELLVVYVPEVGPWAVVWEEPVPELEILETLFIRCEWDANRNGKIDLSDLTAFSSAQHSARQRSEFYALYQKKSVYVITITGRRP